jgi:hypothetical protein
MLHIRETREATSGLLKRAFYEFTDPFCQNREPNDQIRASPYLSSLKIGGTHVLVGAAPEPNQIAAFSIIAGRKNLAGSLIGGIKETQEMLDFCARKNVLS